MKAQLIFNWYTDGDFSVRRKEIINELKRYGFNSITNTKWDEDDSYIGSLTISFEHKVRVTCLMEIRDVLEILSVSMDVLYTHNWLIKDLYEMFESAKKQICLLFNNKVTSAVRAYEYISGNYEGTDIEVIIEEDN